ncbi:MAG TPA: hypothetical protein VNE40_01955 [Candidatus Dormibacteraeota bacterium]|nr:hypothetical protein [Candidatus Dormibacteraeota bacterium]
MSKSKESTNNGTTEQKINRAGKAHRIEKVAASIALLASAGTVGYTIGNHEQNNGPTATTIEQALNSKDHITNDVTVEVGYEIPVGAKDVKGEGTIGISNPIKLSNNFYGYFAPIPQTGEVKLETIQYAKPLQRSAEGGYTEEYAHEITTPIALVYSTYPNTNNGTTGKYYSVVMGSHEGNIANMLNVQPNVSYAEQQNEIAEQGGQFAIARVGELIYSGK